MDDPRMTLEDIAMFRLTGFSALALAAAMAITVAAGPQAAQAQTAASVAQVKASDATDISAFMGLALGTIGAVIANQQRQEYYRQNYYYGGNPYYGGRYYGAPAYYGSGYYNPY